MFTPQQLEALRNIAILVAIIGGALIFQYINNGEFARKYLCRLSRRVFFCGYSMEKVLQRDFLHNVSRYLDLDISGIYAVLMMMILGDNHTARIVSAQFNDLVIPYEHCWVEFRHFGKWYVLDPDWYAGVTVGRRQFKRANVADHRRVYAYDEFWCTPAFDQIYRKMLQSNTSYLFKELYAVAGRQFTLDSTIRLTRDYHLDERSGREFVPLNFGGVQVINRRIADFLIQNRDYREPPTELAEAATCATPKPSKED